MDDVGTPSLRAFTPTAPFTAVATHRAAGLADGTDGAHRSVRHHILELQTPESIGFTDCK